ncbi:MAG: hypothetical protein K1X54_08225, partial [Flavobacteriales bacterium]|nr:hypothetical protein [Flavobacteriales bacterium]
MKLYIKHLFTSIFLSATVAISAQNLTWAKQFGAHNLVTTEMDAEYNLISCGQFAGTVDFDPGAGTTNLSASGQSDIFIQKTDSAGTLLWAKKVGGSVADEPRDMKIDSDGNIYITGFFAGIADFNPGAANTNLTSLGNRDIFILKLDLNGNLLWAKSLGTTAFDYGQGIAVDNEGSVYVCGNFGGEGGAFGVTMDMNPGSGIYNVSTTGNPQDAYLVKLNSDGNFLWGKHYGGAGYSDIGCVGIDSNNNVIFAGYTFDYIDFDESDAVESVNNDIFICSFTGDGTIVWLRTIEASTSNIAPTVLTLDAQNHIHIAGNLTLPANFAPQEPLGYNVQGGTQVSYIWECNQFGTFESVGVYNNSPYIHDIAFDGLGNKYVTGSFYLPLDVDFSDSTYTITSTGSTYNIHLSKYNQENELQWTYSYGSVNTGLSGIAEAGRKVLFTNNNTMYVTGSFVNSVDFNLQEGEFSLNGSSGNSFITK